MEIRTITADEAVAYRRALRGVFGAAHTIDDEDWAVSAAGDLSRTRAAVTDDGRIVATLRSFATELTVPGGATVAASALTAVTVRATHRRQGLLREMIGADLRDSADRGEPLSVLIAAEYPIYGRFGYGLGALHTAWELDVGAARFAAGGEGTVDYVDEATLRAEAPTVFDRVRRARPAMIDRDERRWDIELDVRRPPEEKPWEGFRLVCRDDSGVTQGYATYKVNESWLDRRPRNTIEVGELCAATPAAEARLWRFLAELDLVATITAEDRPVDELLPWLLVDGRAARETSRRDFLWTRVLDVVETLRARTYWAEDRIVFEVVDPLGFATGTYALEAAAGAGACRRTDQEAQLTVPATVLGAVHLGGTRLATLAAAGFVDEHVPGAVARADVLLAGPVSPWCSSWF